MFGLSLPRRSLPTRRRRELCPLRALTGHLMMRAAVSSAIVVRKVICGFRDSSFVVAVHLIKRGRAQAKNTLGRQEIALRRVWWGRQFSLGHDMTVVILQDFFYLLVGLLGVDLGSR